MGVHNESNILLLVEKLNWQVAGVILSARSETTADFFCCVPCGAGDMYSCFICRFLASCVMEDSSSYEVTC